MTDAVTYVRAQGAVASEVDGVLVVLSPDLVFHHLNATAHVVWEALAEPVSRGEVAEALQREFDVDDATVGPAVGRILATLVDQGLVVAAG